MLRQQQVQQFADQSLVLQRTRRSLADIFLQASSPIHVSPGIEYR